MMNVKERNEAKKVAIKFLHDWKSGKVEDMLDSCQLTWLENTPFHPLQFMKERFIDALPMQSYVIKNIEAKTDCCVDVTVMINYRVKMNRKRLIVMRLIKELAPFEPSVDGEWGVNPISAIRTKRGGRHEQESCNRHAR